MAAEGTRDPSLKVSSGKSRWNTKLTGRHCGKREIVALVDWQLPNVIYAARPIVIADTGKTRVRGDIRPHKKRFVASGIFRRESDIKYGENNRTSETNAGG